MGRGIPWRDGRGKWVGLHPNVPARAPIRFRDVPRAGRVLVLVLAGVCGIVFAVAATGLLWYSWKPSDIDFTDQPDLTWWIIVTFATPFVPLVALGVLCVRTGWRLAVERVCETGECPSCLYPLEGLKAEMDGCIMCPECGAAWRLGGEAGDG